MTPYGAEECVGADFDSVRDEFSSAGFTSIKVEKIEDLKSTEADKLNTIESISVGGAADFSKGHVTTHNSCQNVHIIKNRPGKPGLPGFMPRYTGTAKRTTHVNATRKNAAFLGSTLHFGPMHNAVI